MGFDFEVGFVLYRRLTAYPKGDKNDGHLALFLEFADPESLPPGWTRDVKFSLTLVNQGLGKSNIVMGTLILVHVMSFLHVVRISAEYIFRQKMRSVDETSFSLLLFLWQERNAVSMQILTVGVLISLCRLTSFMRRLKDFW